VPQGYAKRPSKGFCRVSLRAPDARGVADNQPAGKSAGSAVSLRGTTARSNTHVLSEPIHAPHVVEAINSAGTRRLFCRRSAPSLSSAIDRSPGVVAGTAEKSTVTPRLLGLRIKPIGTQQKTRSHRRLQARRG
jgi:hypothetical protein